MPATSQKQERFMNFVHAVQKGKASAKGYPKVKETAKTMEPASVEHYMGRGHIDKDLPKQANDMNKQAFERGFLKAAIDNRVHPAVALNLLKQAEPSALTSFLNNNAKAIGGGLGATAGGLAGYMSGDKPQEGQPDNRALRALIGAGVGGFGGMSLGAKLSRPPAMLEGAGSPPPGEFDPKAPTPAQAAAMQQYKPKGESAYDTMMAGAPAAQDFEADPMGTPERMAKQLALKIEQGRMQAPAQKNQSILSGLPGFWGGLKESGKAIGEAGGNLGERAAAKWGPQVMDPTHRLGL